MLKSRPLVPAVTGLAACLLFTMGQAAATESVATLSQVTGVTLVNQGAEYVTATAGMPLREGDRLMVLDGGAATVKFTDGCLHNLADNTILTIGKANSCSSGTLAATQVGPIVAQAVPAGGLGLVGTGIIAAGVVAGVVLVGSVSDTGSDERAPRPLSP
jgi:hypothetical protein